MSRIEARGKVALKWSEGAQALALREILVLLAPGLTAELQATAHWANSEREVRSHLFSVRCPAQKARTASCCQNSFSNTGRRQARGARAAWAQEIYIWTTWTWNQRESWRSRRGPQRKKQIRWIETLWKHSQEERNQTRPRAKWTALVFWVWTSQVLAWWAPCQWFPLLIILWPQRITGANNFKSN